MTEGGSDEGGFEEFNEFWFNRALSSANLALKLADDLMAESHIVGKWGGVRAHAA